MNRPKIDDYVDLEHKLTEEGAFDFIKDFMSYFDEVLDKACETLVTYDTKGNYAKLKWNKEKWKEWLLKDE